MGSYVKSGLSLVHGHLRVLMPRQGRKPDPEKYCETCNARLERKRYNGRLEDLARFRDRSFCDQECARGEGRCPRSEPRGMYQSRLGLRG